MCIVDGERVAADQRFVAVPFVVAAQGDIAREVVVGGHAQTVVQIARGSLRSGGYDIAYQGLRMSAAVLHTEKYPSLPPLFFT